MGRLTDFWMRFDERAFVSTLAKRERANFLLRLSRERTERIATIGWLGLGIASILFLIDLARWQAGTLLQSPTQLAILTSHIVIALAGATALLLRRRYHANPMDPQRSMQMLHLVLAYGGTMANGLLGLAERQDVFSYGTAVMVLNFLYPLPQRVRTALSAIALMLALGIAQTVGSSDSMNHVLILGEITAISFFAIIAGGAIYRQFLRAVRSEQILERLAHRDGLTGLANRRHAEELLTRELTQPSSALRFAVVLADLDHFKQINDRAGHAAGDDVLRAFAGKLDASCRSEDLAARWGGEEFLILCRDTDAAGAQLFAERVRTAFSHLDTAGVGCCTASFGIAMATPGDTINSLVARADTALYAAKREGRNRTVIAASDR